MWELSVCLTSSKKKELQQMMADSYPILAEEASRLYGKPHTRTLRENFRDISGEPRQHLDLLMANEEKILGGYIKTVMQMVRSFYLKYRKSGTTIWDYIQEASTAIVFKAIYNYNGATEFTTFVHFVVRNHLIDLREEENSMNRNRVRNLSCF